MIRGIVTKALVAAFGIAALAMSPACFTEACTLDARTSFSVSVFDAAGARICDATVSYAHEGGPFRQTQLLPGPNDQSNCYYAGPIEEVGRFVVAVEKQGYARQTVSVDVEDDGCHPEFESVRVVLTR